MELITNNSQLRSTFERLARDYKEWYWAVAWASPDDFMYHFLDDQSAKKFIIVGLDRTGTHPDFLKKFPESSSIKFISKEQTCKNLFHPKIYLFWNSDQDWTCIIGSANFTKSAFSTNEEACVYISSNKNNTNFGSETRKYIFEKWQIGFNPSQKQIAEYEKKWRRQPNIEDEMRDMNSGVKDVLRMNWSDYYEYVRNEGDKRIRIGHVEERIKLLEIAHQWFKEIDPLTNMNFDNRRRLFGLIDPKDSSGHRQDWGAWGRLRNTFEPTLRDNFQLLDSVIKYIPVNGKVHEHHYSEFVNALIKLETDLHSIQRSRGDPKRWSMKLATASRLLVYKRPDTFVSINGKIDASKMYKELRIDPRKLTIENYWHRLIEPVHESKWWNSKPLITDSTVLAVWKARAAFLDSIYYERDKVTG